MQMAAAAQAQASPLAAAGLASLTGAASGRRPSQRVSEGLGAAAAALLAPEHPAGAATVAALALDKSGTGKKLFSSAARAVTRLERLFDDANTHKAKVSPKRTFKCHWCAHTAPSRAALRRHEQAHVLHKCNKCTRVFGEELELFAHMCKEHPQPSACCICGAKIRSADPAATAASGDVQVFCPICSVMLNLDGE